MKHRTLAGGFESQHRRVAPTHAAKLRASLLSACMVTSSALLLPVRGQAVDASPAGAADSLQEVVVTAQKRTENIQSVPMSVTALGQIELEREGIYGFQDYGSRVPNLSFNAKGGDDGRSGATAITIRGIAGVDTTALYLDDTPVPQAIDLKIVDIDRIEVLRGPQGTLYGAESMGGAVKLVTHQPDLTDFAASIRMRGSDTDPHGAANFRWEGMLNDPIVKDVFGIRVVGFYEDLSGVFDRVVGLVPALNLAAPTQTVEHRVDGERNYGVHVSGNWAVSDRFTVTPRFIYQKIEADGAHFADNSPDNFVQYRYFGLREPYDDTTTDSSLGLSYAWDFATLTLASSYITWRTAETEDSSEFDYVAFGLPFPVPSPITKARDFNRETEELRLASSGEGPFTYLLGAFYSDTKENTVYNNVATGINVAAGGAFGTDLVFFADDKTPTREAALFGELSYKITPSFTATAGARSFNTTVSLNRIQSGIVVGPVPNTVVGEQKEHGINPKFALKYQLTDDAMVYTSAAKGFRLGGVNPLVPLNFCAADLAALGLSAAPTAFSSDSLWNYEVGSKSSWLDRRLTVDGALFYINWTGIQQSVNLACGFNFTGNVGAAISKGAELELSGRPTDNLKFKLGLGYTDAYISASSPEVAAQVGDRVEQAPRWTGNAAIEYTRPIGGERSLFTRLDEQFQSRSFTTFDEADPLRVRRPYSLVNLHVGLDDGLWETSLFADNLTDRHLNLSDTVSLAAELPGRPRYATNRPRTVGVEVVYRIGR